MATNIRMTLLPLIIMENYCSDKNDEMDFFVSQRQQSQFNVTVFSEKLIVENYKDEKSDEIKAVYKGITIPQTQKKSMPKTSESKSEEEFSDIEL